MKNETFDFSEALRRMKEGKLTKRENGLYPFGIDEEGIFYQYAVCAFFRLVIQILTPFVIIGLHEICTFYVF